MRPGDGRLLHSTVGKESVRAGMPVWVSRLVIVKCFIQRVSGERDRFDSMESEEDREMKKFVVCAVLAACLMVGSANAATIYLANPTPDGGQGETSGSLVLGGGESGTINIMLDTFTSDFKSVAFVNAFLDHTASVCDTNVTGVTHGQIVVEDGGEWTYDVSAYKLPADIGNDCDGLPSPNEYGLVFGSSAGPGFPAFTNATYIIDSLTVTHDGSDTHNDGVLFEGGARKPQAFGSSLGIPPYDPYTTNDFSCAPIPTLLNMGVGNYTTGCVDAFDITKVPEPAALSLLALGGLVALRRRR